MTVTRGQILTIGPVLLVATCYAIAAPSPRLQNLVAPVIDPKESSVDRPTDEPISERCNAIVESLRNQLSLPWTFIVREPFVLGSDLSQQDSEQFYNQTIVPTVQALSTSYFDKGPVHPITILLCSSDRRFRECNVRLDDQERDQYSGIYSRKHRRVIVNVASGDGTLAHELTHALAHVDFPTMPEWFDEGLASLHEECEFSDDGRHLIGNENWRQNVALEALEQGELRLLQDVTSKRFGSLNRANLDYAHVRSLCLYLQERGLLEEFYRTCRANSNSDATGLRSLCHIAGTSDPKTLDDQFRAWLIARSKLKK